MIPNTIIIIIIIIMDRWMDGWMDMHADGTSFGPYFFAAEGHRNVPFGTGICGPCVVGVSKSLYFQCLASALVLAVFRVLFLNSGEVVGRTAKIGVFENRRLKTYPVQNWSLEMA